MLEDEQAGHDAQDREQLGAVPGEVVHGFSFRGGSGPGAVRLSADGAEEELDVARIGVRRDAVAEVEDVGAAGEGLDEAPGGATRAAPPATSSSGSRLPWTQRPGCTAAAAHAGSTAVSSATACDARRRGIGRIAGARAARESR